MKLKNKTLFASLSMALLMIVSTACGGGGGNGGTSSKPSDSSSGGGSNTPISTVWPEMPENTNENLKYFGYFHGDGFGSQQGSYIAEIAALGNSNIIMINSAWDASQALTDLAEAKKYNFKVIITPHCLFRGGQVGKLNSCHLRDDYQASWDAYQAAIQSYIDDGTIYAFNFDEPRWNGVSRDDFHTATKYIREKSGVGIMVCMTAMDMGWSSYAGVGECEDDYMKYCTDVMFDDYGAWDADERLRFLEILKSKSPEDAWVWGCPRAMEAEPEITGMERMEEHIKGQYIEAVGDERYAGIIAFTYANGVNEGDWGYGLCDFFNDQHDYYDKDFKDLYIDIGCEITGLTPPDRINIDFVVKEATETYKLGDLMPLPEATAFDDAEKSYDVSMKVYDPDGVEVTVTDGKFAAEKTGAYEVKCSVIVGAKTFEKSTYVYVKEELEISTFESKAFKGDQTGDDDDKWCWPRELDFTFGHNDSKGSLKVTPHATDGSWPNVYFRVNQKKKIDISAYGGFSCWLYNTGDEPISTMGLKFNNGQGINEATKVFTLPAKEWTKVSVTTTEMLQMAPGLDLTKVNIGVCNSLIPYDYRPTFYIDDVYFLPAGAQPDAPATDNTTLIDFEGGMDKKYVSQDGASNWCWPSEVSEEQAKGGSKSLKVVPHVKDGTWPQIYFNFFNSKTFDMSGYDKVSIWAYNAGTAPIEGFALEACNPNDLNGVTARASVSMPVGTWVEFSVKKTDIVAAGIDPSAMCVRFVQGAGAYENRCTFFLDEVELSVGGTDTPVDPEPPVVSQIEAIGFESASDVDYIYQDASNRWCWPCAISTEMAKSGSSSLKVTPHATDGDWPKLEIVFGTTTFDLTNYDKVSIWVYNTSDSDLVNFGLTVLSGDKKADDVKNVPAKTWTEFVVTKAALIEKGADITALRAEFGQCNGTYDNRAAFYLDDAALLVNSDEPVVPEPPVVPEVPTTPVETDVLDFEDAAQINNLFYEEENAILWPASISTDYAKSGSSSLMINPHDEWGSWLYIGFKFGESQTFDMTDYDEVSFWVYNASDAALPGFGIWVYNDNPGSVRFIYSLDLPAGEWTRLVVTKEQAQSAGLDITALRVRLANFKDYTNRGTFYVDDIALTKAATVEDTDAIGFESDAELANVYYEGENNIFWPSSISSTVAHSGSSSLKINPHPEWGTWLYMGFKFGESETFDMTDYDEVSLWVYNATDSDLVNFGIWVYNGAANSGADPIYYQTIPAGEWVKLFLTKADIEAKGYDVTALKLRLANFAEYTNRGIFHVDDVMLTKAEAPVVPEEPVVSQVDNISFENAGDIDYVYMNDDGKWAWPHSISTEMAKSGNASFKVDPRQEAGQWPKLEILFGGATFDLTNYDKVSIWIYNASEAEFVNFGWIIFDASGKKIELIKNVPAGEWTEYVVTKEALVAKSVDITALRAEFAQCNGTYVNRGVFYLDDAALLVNPPVVASSFVGFESEAELSNLQYSGENNVFWPASISTDVAKSGNSSLKITPHASWGTWPSVVIKFSEDATFDMTNYEKVSFWLYNSGSEDIPNFMLMVKDENGKEKKCTKHVVAGTWTEYSLTKAELEEAGLDVTKLTLTLGNNNSDYQNRAVFYVDDVKLS